MSTSDLKLELIHKISQIKEIRIIEEIQKLLDFELEKGEFQLTDAQIQRINEAKKDDIFSEEEANQEIEKWLHDK